LNEVAEALEGLRRKFLARSADDLAALRAWSEDGAPADDATHRLVHRLAGAAGTFGFLALSDLAKQVDNRLAGGEGADAAEVEALVSALETLAA
jgi:HPt (histidine-containing phosphotransfer) domain-containing protein